MNSDRAAKIARIQRIERIKALEAANQPKEVSSADIGSDSSFDPEAALQGVGQGISLGYIPELQAATQAPMDWALEKIASTKLGSKIMNVPQGAKVDSSNYDERLKEAKTRDVSLAEKSPGSYMGGQVAGVLSTLPLVTAGAAKVGLTGAATTMGRIKQAAATGGLLGAAQNVEGENLQENLLNRLKNAGLGAGFGAAGQGLSEGVKAIPRVLEKAQTLTGLKAAGANTSQLKELLKKNLTKPMADFMNKSGMLKAGYGVDDVLEKATQLADDAGAKIGQTYDDLMAKAEKAASIEGWTAKPEHIQELVETQAKLHPSAIADDFLNIAKNELKGVSGGQQALSALENELKNVVAMGDDAGIKELLKYRQSLDDTLNWNKTFSESKVNQQALKRLRSFVQDRLDNHFKAVEKMAGGSADELISGLKDAKDTYGKALKIKDISRNAVAREMAKMPIGLPEIGAGGAYGIATGDPTQGLMAAGAMKGARYLGPGAAYQALGVAKKLTKPFGQMAEKVSPFAMGRLTSPWVRIKGDE